MLFTSSTTCCLVTGSTDPSSIGYACVHALFDAGADKVTIMGRTKEKVEAAIDQIKTERSKQKNHDISNKIFGIVGDLKLPSTMKKIVNDAIYCMGGQLDILMISGGNGYSEYLGLDPNDPLSYHMTYDVAVVSPMMLIEAFATHAEITNGNSISGIINNSTTGTYSNARSVVVIGSMAGSVPWPNTAPYNYAKAAQNSMIETLAFKHRTSNIRVNGVLPSCIHTGALDVMASKKHIPLQKYVDDRAISHPMERIGTVADVTNAAIFLASSNMSGYITGELLQVNGGLHLSNWFNLPNITKQYRSGDDKN